MTRISVAAGTNRFAENKEDARRLRQTRILPALDRKDRVVLDFKNVSYATQSFIHALIGEALQRYGEPALDLLEFKNCSPALRSVIALVVDYSLGGFPERERA